MKFFSRKETVKKRNPQAQRNYARSFLAATVDRLTSDWKMETLSADASIYGSLAVIRGRARDLCQNHDYARGFLLKAKQNVIGHNGINPQMKVVERKTKEGIVFDAAANEIIEQKWYKWAKKKHCTVDRRLSWKGLQRLAVVSAARDGEVFIRKIKGRAARNPFGFALQLIEADHLPEMHNEDLQNGNRIRMSIELDPWNRPVAYHVLRQHPGDRQSGVIRGDYERIPAEDIIHLFVPERISQTRGISWFISAMYRMKMLRGYEEAEIIAARMGAQKMGFFETEEGEYVGDEEGANGETITHAEPGIFEQLPPGMKFHEYDPTHPNSSYSAFVKGVLRGAASGLGISYNSLASDLEGVNFSSIRQGALEERDYWKILQDWIIEDLCEDVFEDWLLWGLTTQEIPLPESKYDKFNQAIWRPRGWQWVDPLKEVKAGVEAINAGLKSAQDIASEQGNDIEDVYAQLKAEKDLRELYGISLPDPNKSSNSKINPEDTQNDPEDDPEEN